MSATALSATRGLSASRFALSTCLLTYGGADWGAGEGWRSEGEGVAGDDGGGEGGGGEKKVGWVQEKLVRCKLAGENALTAHSAPDLWERRWVAGGVVGS